MPSAETLSGSPPDPHGIGPHLVGLSGSARRAIEPALLAFAEVADLGEIVQQIAVGRFLGHDGALILTDRRAVAVNSRQWKADMTKFHVLPGMRVRGWDDRRTAALVVEGGGSAAVIDQIRDRDSARRMADAIRRRAG